jgi:hypothetical protein
MKLDSIIERAANYPFQQVLDETIIVNPKSRLMHSLNEVGGFIWQKLSNPIKVDELIDSVISEYEIDKSQAQKDVTDFLEDLEKQKLIAVVK